jgi:hypothetical protein
MLSRKPFTDMSADEIHAWIQNTREHLQRKMQREQEYLNRRAARGIRTPTDDAYRADLLLEASLLALLDELEQSL